MANPVAVRITFDKRVWGNPAVQRAIWNAARFVRDLWLARSPHLGGDYARGLTRQQSIGVTPGVITVRNLATHAAYYEKGVRAFNWGMRTLEKGKNVKISKDGFRYKVIRIEPKGRVAFRKPSVPAAVIAAFRQTIPRGRTKFSNYEGIDRYRARRALQKPIKARKPLASAMKGFFVVSEKAIRNDPRKWMHKKVEGKHLARDIEAEATPIIQRAIDQAVAAERARQERMRRMTPGARIK